MNNNSFSIAEANSTVVAHQPHRHREDEAPSTRVGILDDYEYRH